LDALAWGEETFEAFYRDHPVILSTEPLSTNFDEWVDDSWYAATLYIPLPLQALSFLTTAIDYDLLQSVMPPCDPALFDPAALNTKGYYDADYLRSQSTAWCEDIN
jgi:hypothetical protein